MIHIVFQRSDVGVLNEAIKLDESLQGAVILIEDDFAVGPIKDIFSEDGWGLRSQWWREVLKGGDYEGAIEDGWLSGDNRTVSSLKEKLQNDPEEIIWIWPAQNKHDVSGYYWLMSQLRDFQGRIFILYLNNLPFINEKGNIFYPVNLFDIPPKEFLKARKLARPITPSEFEVDPDEWMRLGNEQKHVRILEGGKKLVQHDDDFYDASLKKFITANWQTAHKIILNFLHKATTITGDAYLLWRLKLILASGEYDVQGELKKMKDFEIKMKAGHPDVGAQSA
ncbi:MAG TPA: DUF1835 domain-containing protein [Puia sp.]|nr:DUF1835 domain-containing protein [Puia sp.]